MEIGIAPVVKNDYVIRLNEEEYKELINHLSYIDYMLIDKKNVTKQYVNDLMEKLKKEYNRQ